MNPEELKKFFKLYSENVDKADQQAFWKLSDVIILEIIRRHIPSNLTQEHIILDAGGGTGRWVVKLSRVFNSKFIIYDLSEDMLKRAEKNVEERNLAYQVKLIKGDLRNMETISNDSVDYIISVYNPISFIHEKEKAFNELFRILKPRGIMLIMGQGYHNAIASKINNYTASPDEILGIESDYLIKWAPQVPKLNLFSKEVLENDLHKAGFHTIATYGIPVFTQPGFEDFDPENIAKSRISQALENPHFFRTVFDIEMKYNKLPELVNRGMNLLAVGEKSKNG